MGNLAFWNYLPAEHFVDIEVRLNDYKLENISKFKYLGIMLDPIAFISSPVFPKTLQLFRSILDADPFFPE